MPKTLVSYLICLIHAQNYLPEIRLSPFLGFQASILSCFDLQKKLEKIQKQNCSLPLQNLLKKKKDSFKSQIVHRSNTMIFKKHFLQNRALVFTNCLPCTGCCTRHGRGQEVPDENQRAQTGSQQRYYVWLAQKCTTVFY